MCCTDGMKITLYFEFEIKFIAHAIPKKLNPCCYDVLMQLYICYVPTGDPVYAHLTGLVVAGFIIINNS